MNKKFTAVVLAAVTLGMIATVSADPVSDDENTKNDVTANVTSTVAMDVKPEDLSYPDLTVGGLEENSNRSFGAVEIANTGSEYIDQVWLGTTYPDTRPFDTGNPKAYNAGNFMVVQPENQTGLNILGDTDTYHFVNRKEFADPNPPSFIRTPSGNINSQTVDENHVGQIRFGDQWFYYTVPTADGDQCSGGSGQVNRIRVGTTSHTQDKMGTVDFTDDGKAQEPVDWKTYAIDQTAGTSSYGISNTSVTFEFRSGSDYSGNQTYDILTACDGTTGFDTNHIVLSKYNVNYNTTGDVVNDGTASTYVLSSTGNAQTMLKPGESFTLDTGMRTPRGVSAGQVEAGSLTVYATADDSAQVS